MHHKYTTPYTNTYIHTSQITWPPDTGQTEQVAWWVHKPSNRHCGPPFFPSVAWGAPVDDVPFSLQDDWNVAQPALISGVAYQRQSSATKRHKIIIASIDLHSYCTCYWRWSLRFGGVKGKTDNSSDGPPRPTYFGGNFVSLSFGRRSGMMTCFSSSKP